MEKKVLIYAIRCKQTGRMYIGDAMNPKTAVNAHFRKLVNHVRSASRSDAVFQEDYDRYGRDNFELYVLEEISNEKEIRKTRKAHWVKEYHSDDPRYGYNRTMQETFGVDDVIYGLPPRPKISKDAE